jgi:hypothetical protein
MKRQLVQAFAICATLTSAVHAQNYQRQASIVGGGNPNQGKCTIEVVVDGAAQVEIRGASATLRNLSGRPAQWRRFECNAGMPANPANFRIQGIDGRGRQTLIRDPQNGGVAVVQIEDKDNGSEGYTFDVMWDARGYNGGPVTSNGPIYRENNPNQNRGNDPRDTDQYRNEQYRNEQYRPNNRDSSYYRQYGHGFAKDEAVRVCQQEVSKQATQRFRGVRDIHFQRTMIDDKPGREDWVTGTLDIHHGPREETYGFSCSVNFDNGQVRTAQLDPRPLQADRR